MGALWMWGDIGPSMRGAILFCGFVVVLCVFIGARSDRKTRRKIAENERRLELLRTKGYDALKEELVHEEEEGRDAA